MTPMENLNDLANGVVKCYYKTSIEHVCYLVDIISIRTYGPT